LFNGKQRDILAHFSRKEQHLIGTWQFYLPYPIHRTHKLGLFPKLEKEYWNKLYPALTSMGTNSGFGAVFNPGIAFKTFENRFSRHYRIRLSNIDPDLL
ncbi:MAG: hypothetical protein V1860_00005, partial [bacterium]